VYIFDLVQQEGSKQNHHTDFTIASQMLAMTQLCLGLQNIYQAKILTDCEKPEKNQTGVIYMNSLVFSLASQPCVQVPKRGC
jgi:hypothetical protein